MTSDIRFGPRLLAEDWEQDRYACIDCSRLGSHNVRATHKVVRSEYRTEFLCDAHADAERRLDHPGARA